jgi:predicted nucleotidyltransferase
MTTPSLPALPPAVQKRLDDLRASLLASLGDALESLLVHGSAVRGGYDPARSDVDLVVVVRDDAREKLEAIAPALKLARFSARIEAMILRASEIAGAADVFPLFYDDLARGAVLHGTNPFAGLALGDEHRRLRIEQELRELRIRLRRVLVDHAGAPEALAGAVERKVKQLRSPLAALLRLQGQPPADDRVETVFRRAAEVFQVEVGPLLAPQAQPLPAHDALAQLLSVTLQAADTFTPAPKP